MADTSHPSAWNFGRDLDGGLFSLYGSKPRPQGIEAIDDKPLGFGKYKLLSPNQIAVEDPGYLVWAHKNVISREVCSNKLATACENDPRYLADQINYR